MSPEELNEKLQAALDALVPDGCAGVAAPIESASLIGLSDDEAALIRFWSVHRQEEFATGRQCARRALATVGAKTGLSLPDGDGLPLWPTGFLGSISHSRGMAMALAGPSNQYSLLGLDLEKTNRMSEAAMCRVIHPLEATFAGDDQVKASILFSLKEAFYKAQFPRWRTVGNFEDLALCVDPDEGTARVVEMDARFAPQLKGLMFAFRVVADYVVSLAWHLPARS